jgi:hypothetical protein
MVAMIRTVLLIGLSAGAFFAQGPPDRRLQPKAFPPDIVPPELLAIRDALQVDPGHYSLDFENAQTRVLRLTLKGNEAVPMHDDQDALVVCIKECHLRLARPDGRNDDIHLEAGKTRWVFGDRRSEKNLSPQPVEMLFIEVKAKP